jgi:ABC-type nitrate/sulfonate/bicarbonate transport system substrate-binding protein
MTKSDVTRDAGFLGGEISRRGFLGAAGALTLGGLATSLARPIGAAFAAGSSGGAPIAVGIQALASPSITTFQVQAMDQLGQLKKAGLQASLTTTTNAQVIPQILSGKSSIGGASPQSLLAAIEAGAPLVMFAGVGAYQPYYLVTSSKSINSTADLKGKRIGTPDQATSTVYLISLALLGKAGINASQVSWVDYPVATQRTSALISGQVDAALVSPDQALIVTAQNSNSQILNKTPTAGLNLPLIPYECFFATSDFIKTNPKTIQRFTTAYLKTNRLLAGNKQDFTNAATNLAGVNATQAAQLFPLMTEYWGVNGAFDPAWLTTINSYTAGLDKFATPLDVKSITTTKFVAAALASLGVAKSQSDPAQWYTNAKKTA